MPFRASFDCLWCGQPHEARSPDDLEGWTGLCPACLGKADDNGFLRARLRAGLQERSAAAALPTPATLPPIPLAPSAAAPTPPPLLAPSAAAASIDDWYLRRGRFARGPLLDGPWQMELDVGTRWLDAVEMSGVIVELAAGTGWWSTLLAEKGDLWAYDEDETALDTARRRLQAHDLLAHLHVRDPFGPPEREADVVFAATVLADAPDEAELGRRLSVIGRWLRTGGSFVFIEAAPSRTVPDEVVDGPRGPMRPRSDAELRVAIERAGLVVAELRQPGSVFLMGHATAP